VTCQRQLFSLCIDEATLQSGEQAIVIGEVGKGTGKVHLKGTSQS